MDNQCSDDQVQRLLINVSGDVFMNDSTPLALSTPSVPESSSPAGNTCSTVDSSDQFADLDCDMNGFQVHDEMPLDDLQYSSYPQSSEISYPYVDYDGYTPYPDSYLPNPYGGPFNDPICTYAPQSSMAGFPPNLVDFPSTPAIPVHTPPVNIHQPKTPTKSSKPKKKIRTSNSKTSKGKAKEKSFRCPYPGCPRVSTCASNLADHLLTHTNIRDYPCEYVYENGERCTKSFPRPWGLHRHYGDTHKLDVKVEKKNGLRKGSTKKQSGMSGQQPLPQGPPPSLTGPTPPPIDLPIRTSSTDGPCTPPPTIRPPPNGPRFDRIKIITRGPTGPFSCCGTKYPDGNSFMVHNHFHHNIPNSSFCCCDECENARAPAFNTNMDIDSSGVYKNVDPSLLAPFTPAINRHESVSSPALSTSSMDEAPVYTPTESLPDAKFSPNTLANVDADTDMLAPLSPYTHMVVSASTSTT